MNGLAPLLVTAVAIAVQRAVRFATMRSRTAVSATVGGATSSATISRASAATRPPIALIHRGVAPPLNITPWIPIDFGPWAAIEATGYVALALLLAAATLMWIREHAS